MGAFLLKEKNVKHFCTACPISVLRGGKTKFLDFSFHRGIRNQKLGNSWDSLLFTFASSFEIGPDQ